MRIALTLLLTLSATVVVVRVGGGLATQAPPPAPSAASAFLAEHGRAVAANPRGVTFAVGVVGERRTVRQGEVVEIDVALEAAGDAEVVFAGGRHYLGHRSADLTFVVDAPDAAPDPLAGYEDSWVFNPSDLPLNGPSSGPGPSMSDRVTLDEFLRFDRPGHYAFYAVSTAAKPKRAGDRIDERTPGVPTASNVVELDVVAADDAWSREELGRITAALDAAPRPGGPPFPYEAFRRLAFLGGEDALQGPSGA